MIRTLTLRNFRGVREGELRLAPLTVLVGPNNSGKSSVLEALFLAPNPLRIVRYLGGGNRCAAEALRTIHSRVGESGYGFLLHNYTVGECEIKCDGYSLRMRVDRDYINLFVRSPSSTEPTRIGALSLSGNTSATAEGDVREKVYLGERVVMFTHALLGEYFGFVRREWIRITNSGIAIRVAGELSELVSERYVDMTFEPFMGGSFSLYVLLEGGRRVRVGDLGDGAQIYLIARIVCELERPTVLLWDDVEAHLNPRAILRLAEWFSELVEGGTQVIVSTHSLEATGIISAVNDYSKILLLSLRNGKLEGREMSAEEVKELYEAGIDIRMAGDLLL